MPSNAELIEDIKSVCEEKGVEVPSTDGLNKKALTDLLKGLKSAEAEAEAEAEVEAEAEAEVEAEAEAEVESVMRVADKKSIVGRRGIIGSGREITEKDLTREQIARFVKSGHIVK